MNMQKKMKKGKAGYTMSVSMIKSEAEFLRGVADADNRSLSEYVRLLCRRHIKELRKK